MAQAAPSAQKRAGASAGRTTVPMARATAAWPNADGIPVSCVCWGPMPALGGGAHARTARAAAWAGSWAAAASLRAPDPIREPALQIHDSKNPNAVSLDGVEESVRKTTKDAATDAAENRGS